MTLFILLTRKYHLARLVKLRHVLLDLGLDNAPFLLDHEHFLFAANKVQHAAALEWPNHAHLVDVDPQSRALVFGKAESVQRLQGIQVALARGDNAEPGIRQIVYTPINGIRADEGGHCFEFGFEPLLNLRPRQIWPTVVQPSGRGGEVFGYCEVRQGVEFDGRGAFDGFRNSFKAHPHTAVTGKRETIEPVVEEFSHTGRVQGGNK